ncbi:hypothetical protein [Flavobacterium sp.]|uniref:hypothetical protein n=1 Tax=Flavobacterium sp. TaxID=239 RepID=UPI002FDDACDE
MLYNISNKDPKNEREINELVGKPFSLIDNIKKGGIGSPKLFITRCSQEIYNLLHVNNTVKFCNIELRPKGIIIGFQSRLDIYALVIPYYKLVVFKPGDSITFHIDHHYISIDCSKNSKGVQKFIDKMELEKEKNIPLSPLDTY